MARIFLPTACLSRNVSKRLGHSNVHVTATIYAHALPDGDQEAAQKWDAFQKRELESADPGGRKEKAN